MITNIIVGLIIVAIVTCAIVYLVRAKKRGVKCVGCPQSGCCSTKKEETAVRSSCCHSER